MSRVSVHGPYTKGWDDWWGETSRVSECTQSTSPSPSRSLTGLCSNADIGSGEPSPVPILFREFHGAPRRCLRSKWKGISSANFAEKSAVGGNRERRSHFSGEEMRVQGGALDPPFRLKTIVKGEVREKAHRRDLVFGEMVGKRRAGLF